MCDEILVKRCFLPQDGLLEKLLEMLETIQADMFNKAKTYRDENTYIEDDYNQFKEKIENPGGFFWLHWCGDPACENKFQDDSKASIRLLPLDGEKEEGACIVCGKKIRTTCASRKILLGKRLEI